MRGMRRTMPSGHRTCRPHRGYASLSSHDRVRLPQPRRAAMLRSLETKGNPWGASPHNREALDLSPSRSRLPSSQTRRTHTDQKRILVLGGVRWRLSTTAQKNHQGQSQSYYTKRRSISSFWATAKLAPAIPLDASATNFSSRSLAQQNVESLNAAFSRTGNRTTAHHRRQRAHIASTRSPTNIRNWAATTPWCITAKYSPSW